MVPDMKQLMDLVIPRVAADWRRLAFAPEFEISTVKIITLKGSDDPELCCEELLHDWLSTDHGIKPKNWTTLLAALKLIKQLTGATAEIEKGLAAMLSIISSDVIIILFY